MRITKLIPFLVLLFISGTTLAQLNSTYQFDDTPGSSWLGNPAFVGQEKFFIGFPGLNALDVNAAHTGFTFDKTVDNDQLNFNNVLSELNDVNHLLFSTRLGLLNGGFRVNQKWHVRFGAQLVTEARIAYPKSLFELIYKGNGHPDIIGQNVDLSGLSFNSLSYADVFAGVGTSFLNERLFVGANLHYLNGIAVAYTEKSEFSIYTDPDTYAISVNGDFTYNTNLAGDSATFDIGQDIEDFADQFQDPQDLPVGRGFAVDFGLRYKLTDQLELQAAAMNVGAIKFKENTATYELGGSFTYQGVDFDDLIDDPDSTTTAFEALSDSISDAFTAVNGSGGFTVPTNSQFTLAANYAINQTNDLNLMFAHQRVFNHGFNTASLMYRKKFGRIFWLRGGVQYFDFNHLLVPIGFQLNAGPVQIGLGTNNIVAAFAPTKTGFFTGHVQLALRFGRDRGRNAAVSEE